MLEETKRFADVVLGWSTKYSNIFLHRKPVPDSRQSGITCKPALLGGFSLNHLGRLLSTFSLRALGRTLPNDGVRTSTTAILRYACTFTALHTLRFNATMFPCRFARFVLPLCKSTETVICCIGRSTGDDSEEGCNEEGKQSEAHGKAVQRMLTLQTFDAASQILLYLSASRFSRWLVRR